MLKFKKKDLNQPVTMGVFVEYVDFFNNNVAMKKDIDASTDKILTSNDQLMHEVKAMREEQSAHSGNHKDLVDDIQDLKQRTKRLEAHAGIN